MADPKDECVDCAKLPYKPKDLAYGEEALYDGFRSKPPRKIHPKSRETHKTQPRCGQHWRAWDRARRERSRVSHKIRWYGLTAEEQTELWIFQGKACPCGRKAGPTPPPGVALDHDHKYAEEHCDHDPGKGCRRCVTGYLCMHCNREIIGYLEKVHGDRFLVGNALARMARHVLNPPMAQVRRARTERSA